MSDDARRTGEELQCMWFTLCENKTDIEVNHPILGWTGCCAGCAAVVGIEVPPPVKGWRVRATFTEHGWKREKTQSFMHPQKSKCLANVRMNIELWHPKAEDLELTVLESPILDTGWGRGAWLDSFKKGGDEHATR